MKRNVAELLIEGLAVKKLTRKKFSKMLELVWDINEIFLGGL